MITSDKTKDLIDQVREALATKTPLKIQGGGTKSGIMARDFEGQILPTKDHVGIVDYQPDELVLTVRAGTRLDEIEKTLAEQGQMLTCESPHFGDAATIGGTLACNLSGPARPWGGSIRDLTLGVRLINGFGEHLRFGGQVMKNVAGYDAFRLQAGALGTLGVVTEISLKVMPRHEEQLTLVYDMDQIDALGKMIDFAGQAKPIYGAVWVDGRFYVRLSGARSAVLGTAHKWGGDRFEQQDAFWQKVRELKFKKGSLWRFSIKSNSPPVPFGRDPVIDWAGAQRWVHGDIDMREAQAFASKYGGHVTFFRGGDRANEVRQALTPLQAKLHQRLKESFDPHAIFNRGALYGDL